METNLLWVCLFVALLLGWFLGYKFTPGRGVKGRQYKPSNEMKHRLQLLFDSYTDESIDNFVHSLEVSYDTFDIHISIGKQFRTQGEVEKAILIHQNLMAHPELPETASDTIIYELAKDYQAAGLFDRAESLLLQLSGSKQFADKSQKRLLDLYEHEKDWGSAISQGLRIDCKKIPEVAKRVAQYYCELAEEKLTTNEVREARVDYIKALNIHKVCIRALLGVAKLDIINLDYSAALNSLKQLAELSPENIPLILPDLLVSTKATETYEQHQKYLIGLLNATGQVPIMLAIFESKTAQGDKGGALRYLMDKIKSAPSISALDIVLSSEDIDNEDKAELLSIVPGIILKVQSEQANYRCGHCGFSLSQLHWMCPSCKGWQTIKPVVEYEQGL